MMLPIVFVFLLPVLCVAQAPMKEGSKCCPHNQLLDIGYYKCVYPKNSTKIFDSLLKIVKSVGYFLEYEGFPLCKTESRFTNRPLTNATINEFTSACFDKTTEGKHVLVGCMPTTSYTPRNRVTVRKCCQMGESITRSGCNATDNKFNLTFYDKRDLNKTIPIQVGDIDLLIPGCSDKYLSDEFYLMNDGRLYAPQEIEKPLHTGHYCMENIEDNHYSHGFICFQDQPINSNGEYVAGMVISIVFLLVTLIIYLCDKKRRNLFGLTLISHISCMIVAFSLLVVLRLLPNGYLSESDPWCQFTAYLMLFAFLGAFLWLNVMSIDIWRTFRSLRTENAIRRRKQCKRFALYSTYAWGVSSIITLLVTIEVNLHFMPTEVHLGIKNCWLQRKSFSYYIFFVIPIVTVITCNCILFIITAYRCYKVKAEINKKRDDKDKKRANKFMKKKEQLFLSLKLFIVMGVNWSLEFISFLFITATPEYVWYLTDAINILYGFIIFVIFVLKKKAIEECWHRSRSFVTGKKEPKRDTDQRKTSGHLGTTSSSYCYTTTESLEYESEQQ